MRQDDSGELVPLITSDGSCVRDERVRRRPNGLMSTQSGRTASAAMRDFRQLAGCQVAVGSAGGASTVRRV
jgi:hypothetical protein